MLDNEMFFFFKTNELLGGITTEYEGEEVSFEELFRESPASTRFHGAEKGGLYTHCLGIFNTLCDSTVKNGIDISRDDIATIAIVHDLCKAGLYHINPAYNPDEPLAAENAPYFYDKSEHMRHATLSLEIADELGIKLTVAQRVCIKLHMSGWHQPEDMALTDEEQMWLFDPSLKNLQLLQLVNLADAKN